MDSGLPISRTVSHQACGQLCFSSHRTLYSGRVCDPKDRVKKRKARSQAYALERQPLGPWVGARETQHLSSWSCPGPVTGHSSSSSALSLHRRSQARKGMKPASFSSPPLAQTPPLPVRQGWPIVVSPRSALWPHRGHTGEDRACTRQTCGITHRLYLPNPKGTALSQVSGTPAELKIVKGIDCHGNMPLREMTTDHLDLRKQSC